MGTQGSPFTPRQATRGAMDRAAVEERFRFLLAQYIPVLLDRLCQQDKAHMTLLQIATLLQPVIAERLSILAVEHSLEADRR